MSAPFSCCAHKCTYMSLSRLFHEQGSFSALGVFIRSIVANVVLEFVESRTNASTVAAVLAKRSSAARGAAIG